MYWLTTQKLKFQQVIWNTIEKKNMNRNRIEFAKRFLLEDDEDDEVIELLFSLPFKRKSTQEMILNRNNEGTYNLLIKKYLMTDEDKFMKFFRVSPLLFSTILDYISDEITSEPCNRTPKPISAAQKLCVTLR